MDGYQIFMFFLALVALGAVVLSTRRRGDRSSRTPQPSVRETYEAQKRRAEVGRDLEQLMLELDELSRQIHGRIDTKLARLEILLRQADERIATLQSHSHVQRAAVLQGEDESTPPVGESPRIECVLDEENPLESEAPEPTPRNERDANVIKLASAGLDAASIARDTDRPIGEVELILALDRTRQGASRS